MWSVKDGEVCMPGKKAKVKANYTSSSFDPIFILKGEPLVVAYESEEYPGWIRCINNEGKGGWAPAGFLEISGEAAVANRDYNGAELTVRAGERLTVLEEVCGWCWCDLG
jgi:hypothetical protein